MCVFFFKFRPPYNHINFTKNVTEDYIINRTPVRNLIPERRLVAVVDSDLSLDSIKLHTSVRSFRLPLEVT